MTNEPPLVLPPAFAAAMEDAGLYNWWLKNRGRSYSIDLGMPVLHEAAKAYKEAQRSSNTTEPNGTEAGTCVQFLPELRGRWVTTLIAGKRLGVTPRAVLKKIARGTLVGKKSGGHWLVSTESIESIRKDTL